MRALELKYHEINTTSKFQNASKLMPRNINQGFDDFHKKIRTSAVETQAAKSHRASIEACLKTNFGLNRFTRIGSFKIGDATLYLSEILNK